MKIKVFSLGKKTRPPALDLTGKVPVIRSSICTGEQVAGFRDTATGKFSEIMAIRREADLREFLKTYGIDQDAIRREW